MNKYKINLQEVQEKSKSEINSVLAIIPARGGSKGIPQKNIIELQGKPLIAWTINEAKKAVFLSRIIVSTDDANIKNVALKYKAQVPFLRPKVLSSDISGAIPVLQHSVKYFEEQGYNYDAIMMLQPTSPMRLFSDINECVSLLKADPSATSVISVTDVDGYHPARMKYVKDGVLIDPPFCEVNENEPRQKLTPMYIRNGAIYLVRKRILMEFNSLKGDKSLAYIMPKERSVNIDSRCDLELAELLMSKPDWRNA